MADRIWKCSNPNHKGIRAPGRMRADDIRRYCWPCSQETGYLVQRYAPALERKRKDAKARRQERESQARQRAREAREAREIVAGVDIGKEIQRLMALPALRDELPRWRRAGTVSWTLHRSDKPYDTGHCYGGIRIHLTLGWKTDAASVKAVIAHELAHYVMPEEHHSGRWARTFARVVREGYGVSFDPRGTKYDVHERAIEALRGGS